MIVVEGDQGFDTGQDLQGGGSGGTQMPRPDADLGRFRKAARESTSQPLGSSPPTPLRTPFSSSY